ncbi:MAG: fumarate hydratase [Spirochaetae bacterium HGW-Spirochaetae-7]|nr:MAG: fumarate hydratase [Spirochaetae bacterium HGW-Spirochaetae-7]
MVQVYGMKEAMANRRIPRYYGRMNGSEQAFRRSVSMAFDGDGPVLFDRLPLDPPRVETALGREFVIIPGAGLAALAGRAFHDMQFLHRGTTLEALARVAFDPGSDERDRYVAGAQLDNAALSAAGRFPICQDTGTAAVYGWKGDNVLVDFAGWQADGDADGKADDADALAKGSLATWQADRLRNSQVAPLPDFGEKNTGNNAPLSTHIASVRGGEYRFLFVAKGGGSANKTALFQKTKSLLGPDAFAEFVRTAIGELGVSACPPYRIVVVLGGQSPEETALAGKLASSGALDALPSAPGAEGGPYRDRQLESVVMETAARSGWGAQFGGRFMARDARVVRLPRHAASLPVVVAVSCSAHRQAYAYINRDGWFLERLAGPGDLARIVESARANAGMTPSAGAATGLAPADGHPATGFGAFSTARRVDLGEPGSPETAAAIRSLRAGELVELWGKAVLARDAAHARLQAMIDKGETLPGWTRWPAFYASPTETPEGAAVGSIGPTTSKRMDSYLDAFGARGIFPLTIGKGERAPVCAATCAKYGTAYLAAVGGAAALAASRYVSSCVVIAWPELGMEAVRLVEFTGLPALVAVDSAGNDYYASGRKQDLS